LRRLLKNEDVLDVIFFGSSVKGKVFPKDMDTLILVCGKKARERIMGNVPHSLLDSLTVMTYEEFLKNRDILQTALVEGYSLKFGRLSGVFSFESRVFFFFKVTLKGSERVKFYRALKLLLEETSSTLVTTGCLYTPIEYSSRIEEFFSDWGIPFAFVEVLLPERFVEVPVSFAIDRKNAMEKQAEASR